jgi:hypothetical protein
MGRCGSGTRFAARLVRGHQPCTRCSPTWRTRGSRASRGRSASMSRAGRYSPSWRVSTIGHRKPRPAWVYAEDTLVQVARWMRDYHQIVAGFIPPPGAIWREGGTWSPGLIIARNDATTHNAAWHQGQLTGFFDWDFAGPATPEWDLALAAFAWVPPHVRYVVAAEGFTDFAATS